MGAFVTTGCECRCAGKTVRTGNYHQMGRTLLRGVVRLSGAVHIDVESEADRESPSAPVGANTLPDNAWTAPFHSGARATTTQLQLNK
jgi:hypothetical protein